MKLNWKDLKLEDFGIVEDTYQGAAAIVMVNDTPALLQVDVGKVTKNQFPIFKSAIEYWLSNELWIRQKTEDCLRKHKRLATIESLFPIRSITLIVGRRKDEISEVSIEYQVFGEFESPNYRYLVMDCKVKDWKIAWERPKVHYCDDFD